MIEGVGIRVGVGVGLGVGSGCWVRGRRDGHRRALSRCGEEGEEGDERMEGIEKGRGEV